MTGLQLLKGVVRATLGGAGIGCEICTTVTGLGSEN